MNNLVDIEYRDHDKTILCTFMDLVDSRESVFICSVEYVQCQQMLTSTWKRANGTESNNPKILLIKLNFDTSVRAEYCYTITASNNVATVKVEGTFYEGKYYW